MLLSLLFAFITSAQAANVLIVDDLCPGWEFFQSETSVWMDDRVPTPSVSYAEGGDTWSWVSTPAPASGAVSHVSALAAGVHQHYFENATVGKASFGDTLYTWVYLDPAAPPQAIMLQWNDGDWEQRAYWGANVFTWGTDGTASRRFMGPLPLAGRWVRLDVSAAMVGFEGVARPVKGLAFTLRGGRAYWDQAGVMTPARIVCKR